MRGGGEGLVPARTRAKHVHEHARSVSSFLRYVLRSVMYVDTCARAHTHSHSPRGPRAERRPRRENPLGSEAWIIVLRAIDASLPIAVSAPARRRESRRRRRRRRGRRGREERKLALLQSQPAHPRGNHSSLREPSGLEIVRKRLPGCSRWNHPFSLHPLIWWRGRTGEAREDRRQQPAAAAAAAASSGIWA